MKVCIDPGHGGRDPGAVGNGLREKDITLAVALKCRPLLAASGIDVILTRDSDVHLGPATATDLQRRCDLANRAQANAYISIHANSAANQSSVGGTETWAYAPGGQGERLARAIQAQTVKALGYADRGVRFQRFYVLRNTAMPAALVELGFISNPREAQALAQADTQARAAEAIARGVCDYFGVPFRGAAPPPSPRVLSVVTTPDRLDLAIPAGRQSLTAIVRGYPGQVSAAIRGGYFDPAQRSKLVSFAYNGVGLCWRQGLNVQGATGNSWPVLIVSQGRATILCEEDAGINWRGATFALAAGPVILRAGDVVPVSVIHPSFASIQPAAKRPRAGAGILPDGRVILAVAESMTIWDFATWFRDQNCRDAINLDGGSGTAFAQVGQVTVFEGPGEAAIPNALAVRQ